MQTVYPSSNHAHHAHNNCVHRNIHQLHSSFKDLIYMRKIVGILETLLGLHGGHTCCLIRFVFASGVDTIHAHNWENDVSIVLSCFLVHFVGSGNQSAQKAVWKTHILFRWVWSRQFVLGVGASPFSMQPWTALVRFITPIFLLQSLRYKTRMLSTACSRAARACWSP